ncbi:hypothetical protein ACHAQA_004166 [Verticillium albo-atrum]
MEAISAKLKPYQKEQLHEVADGMLKVYRTLVRMQYLEDSWIQEGPHDLAAILPFCERLGLDVSIIYLYSILPYVETTFHPRGLDFFQGGGFYDFRHESVIEEGRDPMFADNEEEVMRPWMTPLSSIGNHSTAILYDAREHVIGLYAQLAGASSDPNINEGRTFITAEEFSALSPEVDHVGGDESGSESDTSDDRGHDMKRRKQDREGSGELMGENAEEDDGHDDGNSGGEEDDSNEEEDDSNEEEDDSNEEEDDSEDDDPQGDNVWDDMDSRPAPNVLRDMVLWYENLTELPGGEQSGQLWATHIIQPLYLKYGWPGPDFNGNAFLVGQARAFAAQTAKYNADEPLRKVESLKYWLQDEDTPTMRQDREAIAKETDVELEWLARWRLWYAEYQASDAKRSLRDAEEEAQRLCPSGQCQKPHELPIWELSELQMMLEYYHQEVSGLRKEVNEEGGSERLIELAELRRAYMERRLTIYQQAFDACQTDIDEMSLTVSGSLDGTGLGFDHALASKNSRLDGLELEEAAIRAWLAQVPDGASKARKAANDMLQRHEKDISNLKQQIKNAAEGPAILEA